MWPRRRSTCAEASWWTCAWTLLSATGTPPAWTSSGLARPWSRCLERPLHLGDTVKKTFYTTLTNSPSVQSGLESTLHFGSERTGRSRSWELREHCCQARQRQWLVSDSSSLSAKSPLIMMVNVNFSVGGRSETGFGSRGSTRLSSTSGYMPRWDLLSNNLN